MKDDHELHQAGRIILVVHVNQIAEQPPVTLTDYQLPPTQPDKQTTYLIMNSPSKANQPINGVVPPASKAKVDITSDAPPPRASSETEDDADYGYDDWDCTTTSSNSSYNSVTKFAYRPKYVNNRDGAPSKKPPPPPRNASERKPKVADVSSKPKTANASTFAYRRSSSGRSLGSESVPVKPSPPMPPSWAKYGDSLVPKKSDADDGNGDNGGTKPTAGLPEAKSPSTPTHPPESSYVSPYQEGQQVLYSYTNTFVPRKLVLITKIDFDDEGIPYYTIKFDGKEKQTVGNRLSLPKSSSKLPKTEKGNECVCDDMAHDPQDSKEGTERPRIMPPSSPQRSNSARDRIDLSAGKTSVSAVNEVPQLIPPSARRRTSAFQRINTNASTSFSPASVSQQTPPAPSADWLLAPLPSSSTRSLRSSYTRSLQASVRRSSTRSTVPSTASTSSDSDHYERGRNDTARRTTNSTLTESSFLATMSQSEKKFVVFQNVCSFMDDLEIGYKMRMARKRDSSSSVSNRREVYADSDTRSKSIEPKTGLGRWIQPLREIFSKESFREIFSEEIESFTNRTSKLSARTGLSKKFSRADINTLEMSATTNPFDVTNTGNLDDVEQKMRSYDATKEGFLNNEEILKLMIDLKYWQYKVRQRRKIALSIVVLSVGLVLCSFGIYYAVDQMTEDVRPESSEVGNAITSVSTGEIIGLQESTNIYELEPLEDEEFESRRALIETEMKDNPDHEDHVHRYLGKKKKELCTLKNGKKCPKIAFDHFKVKIRSMRRFIEQCEDGNNVSVRRRWGNDEMIMNICGPGTTVITRGSKKRFRWVTFRRKKGKRGQDRSITFDCKKNFCFVSGGGMMQSEGQPCRLGRPAGANECDDGLVCYHATRIRGSGECTRLQQYARANEPCDVQLGVDACEADHACYMNPGSSFFSGTGLTFSCQPVKPLAGEFEVCKVGLGVHACQAGFECRGVNGIEITSGVGCCFLKNPNQRPNPSPPARPPGPWYFDYSLQLCTTDRSQITPSAGPPASGGRPQNCGQGCNPGSVHQGPHTGVISIGPGGTSVVGQNVINNPNAFVLQGPSGTIIVLSKPTPLDDKWPTVEQCCAHKMWWDNKCVQKSLDFVQSTSLVA